MYVEVAGLARALGVVAHADGNVLTWRGQDGPVTLFEGSPDAVAHFPGDSGPTDVALSAPVLALGSGWFVPLDALPLLGVQVPPFSGRPQTVDAAGGRTLRLGYVPAQDVGAAGAQAPPGTDSAQTNLAGAEGSETGSAAGHAEGTTGRASWEPAPAPLAGVRFFDGEGVSLLLVDLALVPLAAPGLTDEVDRAIDQAREAGSDHVLMLMVTSVAPLPWVPVLVFEQDDRRLEVSAPYRLLIQEGDPDSVAPEAPVFGAVLLPSSFSLYRQMRVVWGNAEALVQFRK